MIVLARVPALDRRGLPGSCQVAWCLGSDNYHYDAGRVCANKPVRADYLDQLV